MLISLKALLQKAQEKKFALPHFNVNNWEFFQAVLQAAEKEKSPIIIATTEGALKYAGFSFAQALLKIIREAPWPIAFHLDHGKDLKIIKKAIEIGYSSVMFDGSALPFQKNIAQTKLVVSWARRKKISVEAELGQIKGIEDLVESQEEFLTDPKQAQKFVQATNCDALAVAIGTAHGPFKYKKNPKIDLKRLKQIKEAVSIPLVLHGASGVPSWLKEKALESGLQISKAQGVPDALIKKAIALGICKINIDTDLRIAFLTGVRETLQKFPETIDPRKFLGAGRDLVYQIALEKIKLLGSSKKAKFYEKI